MNKEEPKVTIVRDEPTDITVHPTEGDASRRVRLAKWTAAIRAMSLDNLSNTEVPPTVRVDC